MPKTQTLLGYLAHANQVLEERTLRADGHVLIDETDEQGAPRAWPIARNPRQIIRRTPKGTETGPYVILSSLRLGHPALPGRAALDPTEQLLSLAMDEQVARAAAARQPSSRAESVMLLSVILAVLVFLLCLIVIVAMLPRAGATVVSWIPGV